MFGIQRSFEALNLTVTPVFLLKAINKCVVSSKSNSISLLLFYQWILAEVSQTWENFFYIVYLFIIDI